MCARVRGAAVTNNEHRPRRVWGELDLTETWVFNKPHRMRSLWAIGTVRRGSVTSQFSQYSGQGHFAVASLEAALHRGLDLALGFWRPHPLAEEIGIAAEVLHRCQRDPINPVLHRELTGGGERTRPFDEQAI